jgi:hypothetical protein
MGWRFRRRLRLARGLYLNLGKSGATSVSIGSRDAHLTLGRRGRRTTVGLPGSGLSCTAFEPYHHHARHHGTLIAVLLSVAVLVILLAALGP